MRWLMARCFKELAAQEAGGAESEDVRGSSRTANVPSAGYTMRSSGYSGFHMRS